MYTAPDGSPLRTYYLHWRYTNSEELLSAFSKVRDEIFMPYAVKVLTNAFALRSLVKLRSAEIEKVWHEEIAEHNEGVYRTKARTALNLKDYVAYLELMEKIPIERRTKSEVARIKYFEKNFDI